MKGRKKRARYFDGSLSEGFVSLYTGKTIIMLGFALLGIFLPIFLYELFGYDAKLVILYFGVSSLIYAFGVPFGGMILSRVGYRASIGAGVVFGAIFLGSFYFIEPNNLILLVPYSLLVLTLHRMFYWVPYHVSFTLFSDKKNRARELSIIRSTENLIGVIIPILSGFIIQEFSFDVLFLIAVMMYLLAVFPYMLMPPMKEKYQWGVVRLAKELVSKKRRRTTLAFVADGAEGLVGAIIWPIFIFDLLKGNYFEVGAVSTLIIGVAVLLNLLIGRFVDGGRSKSMFVKYGSVLYSLGYILKAFVATAFHVFVIGTYHRLTLVLLRTPFDTLTYDAAADEGHYVDEFTILHEVSIHIGKVLMAGLVILMLYLLPLQWTFILAAGASLLFNVFQGSEDKKSHDAARI